MSETIMPKPVGPSIKRGRSKQDYETPREFINAVTSKFGPIQFDLAASEANAKAGRFFSGDSNALMQPWSGLGLAWLNPPFDNIAPWAQRCAVGWAGTNILLLVPASVGANWWRDHVHRRATVYFLNGRITFAGCQDPYPKDCALCCFGLFGEPRYEIWQWTK